MPKPKQCCLLLYSTVISVICVISGIVIICVVRVSSGRVIIVIFSILRHLVRQAKPG